ncbi:hypothetical protein L914_20718 [Phytophthora nicotianae]|uniref:MULE transposase domain-containing protein n=1 Tax=Phytophthora nicotianae TaxID=4792 RepID=W2M634_PHYNI|nr:hypothetical protein L914_20718 [Phytophthora nicotianae]
MDSYSPYRFSVLHGSSRVGGLVTTYSCASNDPRDYTLCLYSQGDQHTVEARRAHTLKSTATEKKGINRSVLAEVESLLSGNGPKGCLIALQQRYQNNQARLCLIPTVAQLKNRKQYLNKQAAAIVLNAFRFMKIARNLHWKLPVLKTLLQYLVALQILLALGSFARLENFFRNVAYSILEQRESGIRGVTDGTYKVHFRGCTLVCFETIAVTFETHNFVHRYVPWAYIFVKSETEHVYSQMFGIVKERALEFFDLELKLSFGVAGPCLIHLQYFSRCLA